MNQKQIISLHEEFVAWSEANGFPEGDALDCLHEETTPEQFAWLQDFIERWDEAEEETKWGAAS